MNSVTTNIIIEGASSHKDGSLGLRVSTPELSPQEKTVFFELQGLNLRAVLSPIDDTPKEMTVIDKDIDQKSASERLRAVIFLWWKNEQEGTFEEFYKNKMEKIIETVKGKLPPLETAY